MYTCYSSEAAKRMNDGVTPSPPPTDVGVASSSGSKKVAFDESPDTGFVVVGRKDARGREANRRGRNRVTGPVAATTPPPLFPLLFRSRPPRLGRQCIAEWPLPLSLLPCRTQLDLVARFGRDWLHLRPLPLFPQVLPAPGFPRPPPPPMPERATLPCASMLANGHSFLLHRRLSVSA